MGKPVMVILRFRLHDRMRDEHDRLHAQLDQVAAASLPGYLGRTTYRLDDGQKLAVFRFTDMDALDAWRRHPAHVEAKTRGREFYSDVSVLVTQLIEEYGFAVDE
jgi:heme-degrading monooxygenase HmoA